MDSAISKTTYNPGFASGGVTCKLGALCFYSSSVQVDSFVLRNPSERKAPNRYGFSLAVVYAVWISVIIITYPLCKWYDRYKTAHPDKWWLSYT